MDTCNVQRLIATSITRMTSEVEQNAICINVKFGKKCMTDKHEYTIDQIVYEGDKVANMRYVKQWYSYIAADGITEPSANKLPPYITSSWKTGRNKTRERSSLTFVYKS